MVDTKSIEIIVDEVVKKLIGQLGTGAVSSAGQSSSPSGATSLAGVFKTIDEAAEAAWQAHLKFRNSSLETRRKIIDAMRSTTLEHKEDFSRRILEETKIGRYDHKVIKHINVANLTPGVEELVTRCWSGDHGLTVEEYAPYGVFGAVTPVTHPVETMINNGIGMLAGGNTVVFNPHPASKRVFAYALDIFNRVIQSVSGYENLMTTIDEPTIETGRQMFVHPRVRVLLVTGGPGVVREALKTPKKAITAGPGNPPVVVDETAILDKAARDIVAGASFDNNVICISEKEVFVVNSVADKLIAEMKRAKCVELTRSQIDALAAKAFPTDASGQVVLNRDMVGRDTQVLARMIGLEVPADCDLLIGETEFEHPWVQHEQMMPFLPIVRCRDVDQAIEYACQAEHEFHHTAIIHSLNVATMTKMGKLMNCSIFVKNGPSYAGLGVGGEGYTTYSIASPTGEGVTTARTFCRVVRCALIDYLRIV
ncbi:MAG: aldehyde dehydrogenase family protein [bacterium]|nr:aldehyde dehydrogenase EutE [Candidatus Sumerlaeota bacterium]